MRYFFVFILMNSVLFSFGQIMNEDGEKVKAPKRSKKMKVANDTTDYTLFYLDGNIQRSYRTFNDNSVFNSYEDWKKQTPDLNFGFTGGLLIKLNPFLQLDIGASFFGHGERYNFIDPTSDSTYFSRNRYMQLGVPLKLKYNVGNRIKFYAGLGLMPANVTNIRFDESFRRVGGTEDVVKDQLKIKNDFSSFNLYGLGTVGFTYYLDYIGFNIGLDYRHGLTNTYASTTKMIDHRMNALVFNYGLVFKL